MQNLFKKSNSKIVIIGIVSAIVVILCVVGVVIGVNSKNSKESNKTKNGKKVELETTSIKETPTNKNTEESMDTALSTENMTEESDTEEASENVTEEAQENNVVEDNDSAGKDNGSNSSLEDIDKSFVARVKAGDIMVGGENFGCGSSREHAPVAIKASGISCVIAKSFARIFYRNAINIGLPILECPAASEAIAEGDTVSIDFDTGVITDETTGQTFQAAPFPPFIQNIIAKGGLMNSLKD